MFTSSAADDNDNDDGSSGGGQQLARRGGWLEDPAAAELLRDAPCSIDRVHARALTREAFESDYRGRRPVIIDGLIDDWPARRTWRRRALERRLGDRPTAAGDGANIVQSGGRRGKDMATLAEYLEQMARLTRRADGGSNASSSSSSSSLATTTDEETIGEEEEAEDLFNFDYNFAETSRSSGGLPHAAALRALGAGATGGRREHEHPLAGRVAHGLPFHVHGETWLGLVFGKKRWFLFPPGHDAPRPSLYPSPPPPPLPPPPPPLLLLPRPLSPLWMPPPWPTCRCP